MLRVLPHLCVRSLRFLAGGIFVLGVSSCDSPQEPGSEVVGGAERAVPAETVPVRPQASAVAAKNFPKLGFRFVSPGEPWVDLEPRMVNPDASVCLANPSTKTSFVVVAEASEGGSVISSGELVKVAKQNLQEIAQEVEFSDTKRVTINGIPFVMFTSRAQAPGSGRIFNYTYYVSSHRGYYYQAITNSGQASLPEVAKAAKSLVSGMSVVGG